MEPFGNMTETDSPSPYARGRVVEKTILSDCWTAVTFLPVALATPVK